MQSKEEIIERGKQSARTAGLRYVSDARPGIRRENFGKQFRYRDPEGRVVRHSDALHRIKSLAIPPAWTDVWISPLPNSHLQATGRDARGRKQHRYHPGWREVRDQNKFARMIAFGEALPRMRARIHRDLRRQGLPKPKVLATVVRLLEISLIRVGNEEYARQNRSYGLTTLRDRHADIRGSGVRFRFLGKSNQEHDVDIRDPRRAAIIQRCQELPGQELFQYLDENERRQKVDSTQVNEYLEGIGGRDFTAKDFRTWAGSILAAIALRATGPTESHLRPRDQIIRAIKTVAECLRNTPAVCKKCYIHPEIFESYLDGSLARFLPRKSGSPTATSWQRHESKILALLRRRSSRASAARNGHSLFPSASQKRLKTAAVWKAG